MSSENISAMLMSAHADILRWHRELSAVTHEGLTTSNLRKLGPIARDILFRSSDEAVTEAARTVQNAAVSYGHMLSKEGRQRGRINVASHLPALFSALSLSRADTKQGDTVAK